MDKVIALEDDDRSGMVYDTLAVDMAKAAKLVYNACLRAQVYAEQNQ